MNRWWSWIKRVTFWLFIFLLITMAIEVGYSKITGSAPRILGHEVMSVLSGSMEPSIQTGSIIAIKMHTNETQYELGDVITFRSADDPNILITHRIIEVNVTEQGIYYATKGDNNDVPDPSPVAHERVVGKYANITIPYIGQFLAFMKTKIGIFLLLFIPGIFLVLSQFWSIWRLFTKEDIEENASEEQEKLANS